MHKYLDLKKCFFAFIALNAILLSIELLFALPSYAERPRAVKAVIEDTKDADRLSRQNYQRAKTIFDDYLLKAQKLDKMDNDMQYLLGKAGQLQGEELQKFIQKYLYPKNTEIMHYASSITSPSSAIRDLNRYYMECAQARMQALNLLVELSRYKVPKTYMSRFSAASIWGCSAANFSEMYVDEHIPYSTHVTLAKLRSSLDTLFIARNNYLNRRAYIERHVEEIIDPDE
ncbi:MAG: hypothetical protein K6G50_04080 [bacterium]|nr:hypothetical protein [bacterium]